VNDEGWNIQVVELAFQAARDTEAAEIYRELWAALVEEISAALRAYLERIDA
jgi:hypothetical protein